MEIVKFETPELKGIEESKALQIKSTFEPMAKMLEGFESDYSAIITEANEGITKDVIKKAKRLRIDIGKVRIQTEKVRKAQKEEYLRAGKAIDGVSNILKWAVSDKENKLKEIEKHLEIQEQRRLEKLQFERVELLSQYVEDAHERDLSKFEEDEFKALLDMKRKEQEDRILAEKKAEEERIKKEQEEKVERERLRAENERLKKEAELKAKKEAKLRTEREEKERIEREKMEAKLRAEREEREIFERIEREKREKLEAELKSKKEAEEKAKKEAEEKRQAELNKGDAEKVNDLVNDLEVLKNKYSFKSDKNNKMYKDVSVLIDKIINHIK